MVPTMILFGLILGRWWAAALLAAAVVWPALLVLSGTMTFEVGLLGASLLSLANAAVGVAIHQGVLAVVRHVRASGHASQSS